MSSRKHWRREELTWGHLPETLDALQRQLWTICLGLFPSGVKNFLKLNLGYFLNSLTLLNYDGYFIYEYCVERATNFDILL